MNIKKIISVAGYAMLQPVSFLCMNRQVREAVFVMGSDLLRRYPVNTSSVATRQMRRYAKDFLNGHYWKWEVDGWIGLFEDNII